VYADSLDAEERAEEKWIEDKQQVLQARCDKVRADCLAALQRLEQLALHGTHSCSLLLPVAGV
jgi:hypothetical protein